MAKTIISTRRLSRMVPTLAQLACPARPAAAFTLVELMMAVALSAMLILMAAKCFQLITKTVAAANEMSVENGLLRTGLQLAWVDADYWKSYADPNPPFNKGWTRLAAQSDTGLMRSEWQRYFAPVLMLPRTDTSEQDPTGSAANLSCYNAPTPQLATNTNFDNASGYNRNYYNDEFDTSGKVFNDPYNHADYTPNPNNMQAFDPRSISRVPVRTMFLADEEETNGEGSCYQNLGYFKGYPRFAIGDYAMVSATDMRDPVNMLNPKYPVNPSGTNYASAPSVQNIIAVKLDTLHEASQNDSVSLNIPLDNGVGMYQPLLWTCLFRKLSYACIEYMNSGTPFWWTDSRGLTTDCNTVPLPAYHAGVADVDSFATYRWERDWASRLGNCDLVTRLGAMLQPNESQGGWGARVPETFAFQPTWPSAATILPAPSTYDWTTQNRPFVILVGDPAEEAYASWYQWGINLLLNRGDASRLDERDITRTVWLPYNTTDADKAEPDAGSSWAPTSSSNKATLGNWDLVSKPPQSPTLTTAMVRYGKVMGASDLLIIRVTVADPVNGRTIELSCTPTTTSFRGARQHWRLYSPAYTTTGGVPAGGRFAPAAYPCAGDYYDWGAGPYYVP